MVAGIPDDTPILNTTDTSSSLKTQVGESAMLTMEQVMDRLGCAKPTVYDRISSGILKPIRQGRRIYFNPAEVDQVSEKLKEQRLYKLPPGFPKTPKLPEATKKSDPQIVKKRTSVYDYTGYKSEVIGQLSATATQLYDQGKSIRSVVVELKISYEMATHLYEQWKSSGTEWHISARQLSFLRNRFSWNEESPTQEGFMRVLEKYIVDETTRAIAEARSEASTD
jgi:predicted DNA-binding transcriptional regulator AlpA